MGFEVVSNWNCFLLRNKRVVRDPVGWLSFVCMFLRCGKSWQTGAPTNTEYIFNSECMQMDAVHSSFSSYLMSFWRTGMINRVINFLFFPDSFFQNIHLNLRNLCYSSKKVLTIKRSFKTSMSIAFFRVFSYMIYFFQRHFSPRLALLSINLRRCSSCATVVLLFPILVVISDAW